MVCERITQKEAGNYKRADLPLAVGNISETVLRDEVTKHLERYKLIKLNQVSLTKDKSFLTNLVTFLPGTEHIKKRGCAWHTKEEKAESIDDICGMRCSRSLGWDATWVTYNLKSLTLSRH